MASNCEFSSKSGLKGTDIWSCTLCFALQAILDAPGREGQEGGRRKRRRGGKCQQVNGFANGTGMDMLPGVC